MTSEQIELLIWLMEDIKYEERAEWAWINGLKED